MALDRHEGDLDEDEEKDRHVLEALKPIVREASIMKYDTHHQLVDFHTKTKQMHNIGKKKMKTLTILMGVL